MAAKTDDAGVCRLCGARGPLLQSHIVPKAAYRRILKGPDIEVPKGQPVKVTAKASVLTNAQWTAHLLCGVCEERFGRWEHYAFEFLSQEDGAFPWLAGATRLGETDASSPNGLEVAKLSRFAASLFWRLSVSGRYPSLGPYELEFRKYLLEEGAPFPKRTRLVVVLLDHSRVTFGRVDRAIVTYRETRKHGQRIYRFALLGVDLRLYVGGQIPRAVDERCFARTGRVLIGTADAFAKEMGTVMVNSPPKGLLART
jgi:hypothetical protein